MRRIDLNVNIRDYAGHKQTRKLKREEMIPAVLYGIEAKQNTLLKVNIKEISTMLEKNGENVVAELRLGNETIPAIIKEVQRNPVNRGIMHVDFQPISLHEVIHAAVPVVIINGNRVEKNGWVINKQLTTVEVEGEADRIPQTIRLDVSSLRIGDIIKVADIEVAEELSIVTDKDNVVLSVRAFKEEPLNLEFDRVEPELVKDPE
jgi:large subunit ribosomal protein L25